MTAGVCADARVSLGAYVLGALEPAERGRVDVHLADCDACRDELASFAALPGLLGRVSIDEVEMSPEPHPEMLQRILSATVHERRHERRVRWVGAVAAGVILVAAASVTGVAVTSSHHSSAPVATGTFTGTNATTGITASVVEWPKSWGSALQVKLSGAGYLSSYAVTCRLIVVSKNGTEDVAASWAATPSGKIVAEGSTSLSPSDIKSFKIVDADGVTLVQMQAAPSAA